MKYMRIMIKNRIKIKCGGGGRCYGASLKNLLV